MKIAVWHTGHAISAVVADAIYRGLILNKLACEIRTLEGYNGGIITSDADVHICYGILRNADRLFRACDNAKKPWVHIDKGYWKPGHYDGYYRISLNGTQQTFWLDKIEPDYDRWNGLGIDIVSDARQRENYKPLVCPPTNYVTDFFDQWTTSFDECEFYWRDKTSCVPLQNELDYCSRVVTFNSSVGWEALRQGIPVVSDPIHSIVGAFEKTLDGTQLLDLDNRRKLFAIMSKLQLTLEEIKAGKLWPLIQELLSL